MSTVSQIACFVVEMRLAFNGNRIAYLQAYMHETKAKIVIIGSDGDSFYVLLYTFVFLKSMAQCCQSNVKWLSVYF